MATTITNGTTTVTPTIVTGWETDQESRTVVHDILGRSSAEITLRPSSLRSGTLEMLFETETAAETARTLHAGGYVLTIASSELTSANFTYVVTGSVTASLEDETRRLWLVSADFLEVVND